MNRKKLIRIFMIIYLIGTIGIPIYLSLPLIREIYNIFSIIGFLAWLGFSFIIIVYVLFILTILGYIIERLL